MNKLTKCHQNNQINNVLRTVAFKLLPHKKSYIGWADELNISTFIRLVTLPELIAEGEVVMACSRIAKEVDKPLEEECVHSGSNWTRS
jgi:hypothetical protein